MYTSEVNRMIEVFNSWIGTPYQLGGTTKGSGGGVDCSNLLHQVLVEAGYDVSYLHTQGLWSSGRMRMIESPSHAKESELPILLWRRANPKINVSELRLQILGWNWKLFLSIAAVISELLTLFMRGKQIGSRPFLALGSDTLQQIVKKTGDFGYTGNSIVELVFNTVEIILRYSDDVSALPSEKIAGFTWNPAILNTKLDEYYRDDGEGDESVGHLIVCNPVTGKCIESTSDTIPGSEYADGVQGWFNLHERIDALQARPSDIYDFGIDSGIYWRKGLSEEPVSLKVTYRPMYRWFGYDLKHIPRLS